MKLIIDISEGDYKFIKNLQSLIIGGRGSCKTIQMNVINAIRNGTPYEPMCNAKDEAICEEMTTDGHCNYSKFCPNKENTIPQDCSECKRFDFPYFVVKFDKEQMQEFVNKAKIEVLASIERTQGEWVEIEGGYMCSNCDDIEVYTPNFCPNCGAKMKENKE